MGGEGPNGRVFNLVAKITMDTSEYNSGLSKAAGAAEKIGGKVKSGLATLGKVSVATVAAAGTGVVAIGKQALDAYTNFEQLSGGIETLFGDSAKRVMADASEAFKTAGKDANQYMETSIQSAAALINSLGGDQAKAADLMNMSITDMADNVNKMGTSMEAVENAYRGFSRGNFTMLDNLALGFAGTKEGMQELLDKAQEISGIKYDISSYSDIVEAIHVVQTEMGITGTTALEANETISGSLASMKSAWRNMLTGIADDNADFDGLINNLVDSALTVADNLLPRIEQALRGAGKLISGLAPVLSKAIPDLVSTTLPVLLSSAMDLLGTVGTTIVQTLPAVFNVVKDALGVAFTRIKEKVPAILEAGKEIAISVGEGIRSKWGDIKETVGGLFRSVVDSVVKYGPDILGKGAGLIRSLSNGLLKAAPVIVGKMRDLLLQVGNAILTYGPELLKKGAYLIGQLAGGILRQLPSILKTVGKLIGDIVVFIVKNAPKLIAGGVQLVAQLAVGVVKAIPKIVAAIPELIKGFIQGLMGHDWAGTGSNVIQRIGDGIKAAAGLIRDLFFGAFDTAKKAIFGIFSGIGGWFYGKFAEAKEAAGAAFAGIKGLMGNHWEAVKGIFSVAGSWFSSAFGKAKELASSAFSGIRGLMASHWEGIKGAFAAAGSWFQSTFNSAKEMASTAFSGIKSLMASHWEGVKSIFSGIGEWFRARFTEAKNLAVSAWSDIKSRFAEIKERIKSGLNLGEAFTWGKDMIQNFINGITAKWDALKNTVSSLAGTVKDFLGFSEPKKGPLSNFHTYAPDMIALFIKGIRDNQPKLWAQIARTFGFDLFGNTFGQLKGGGGGGQKSALDKFTELYKRLDNYEILEKKVNGIADPFGAIGLSITELVEALNDSASQEEFSARMMREYSPRYEEYSKFIWDEMAEAAREVALASSTATAQDRGGESITINVYPSAGMDEERLADLIDRKLAERYNRRRAVFG